MFWLHSSLDFYIHINTSIWILFTSSLVQKDYLLYMLFYPSFFNTVYLGDLPVSVYSQLLPFFFFNLLFVISLVGCIIIYQQISWMMAIWNSVIWVFWQIMMQGLALYFLQFDKPLKWLVLCFNLSRLWCPFVCLNTNQDVAYEDIF